MVYTVKSINYLAPFIEWILLIIDLSIKIVMWL